MKAAQFKQKQFPWKTAAYLTVSFLLFAFLGWVWEGFYVGRAYSTFLNRGFLHGPWLPIYGLGGTAMIALLSASRDKPIFVFTMAAAISGVLEYVASSLLEMIYHTRWWDYSSRFLNVDGRVCFSNLILFGLAGLCAVYIVDPFLRKFFVKRESYMFYRILLLICALFLVDLLFSLFLPNTGLGITSPTL